MTFGKKLSYTIGAVIFLMFALIVLASSEKRTPQWSNSDQIIFENEQLAVHQKGTVSRFHPAEWNQMEV